MKINCSTSYALSVISDRKVYRCKATKGARWCVITKPSQVKTGYLYAVDSLIGKEEAKRMNELHTKIGTLEDELSSLKEKFLMDATAYRSVRPRNTYKVETDEVKLAAVRANNISVLIPEGLKEKLGSVFNDLFYAKPVTYLPQANVRDAVIAAMNGEVIPCDPSEFLASLTIDPEGLAALMRSSVKANALTFEDVLHVNTEVAMEFALDYQACTQYKLLSMLAEACGMEYEDFVNLLSITTDLTTTNRISITSKE